MFSWQSLGNPKIVGNLKGAEGGREQWVCAWMRDKGKPIADVSESGAYLKQLNNCVFHLVLNKPKLFITFVSQNLAKHSHIVLILGELLYSIDDCCRPFYD